MSRKYKFHNPEGVYFISFAVVYWIDVFTRKAYQDIIIESLKFCQSEKGMEIYAWCVDTPKIRTVSLYTKFTDYDTKKVYLKV